MATSSFVLVVLLYFKFVLSHSLAIKTAFVEIVVRDSPDENSRYRDKFEGIFANIGSYTEAKGDILQIHPFALCNISRGSHYYSDEWVGVIKLTTPAHESQSCNNTVKKAIGAVKNGANAVIFDVTDSPQAAKELDSQYMLVERPVLILSGEHAKKLMNIVKRQYNLKARISTKPLIRETQDSRGEYVDMVIFMTCFILVTITCFILLIKIKWRQNKKESSLSKMAFDAVDKMESRKYKEHETETTMRNEQNLEHAFNEQSTLNIGAFCVICLEEFKEGEDVRVVSCGHEFHLKCVDPWLLTNYTCPLCMLNIVEREGNGIKSDTCCTPSIPTALRCCFRPSPLSSSSMVYSVTLDESTEEGVSLATSDIVETGDCDLPTTIDNICKEQCKETCGKNEDSKTHTRKVALMSNEDIFENMSDRQLVNLNSQDRESKKESAITKSMQLLDTGKRKSMLELYDDGDKV
ncbi:E3 ubiquitin-protein ligase ZNRF3-like [Xenia sp. Carnegie-2017]|uniref:E3 ubiquitin-protein ligase ZNRF3-like n=1 Tax=Xenia sp. Carnegie-2017 TaxID=2897299 RepID=UPI001F03414A|nr:E3 ubiquitin-protein ligase ZNRF3-like [Xenia sp. Carnegie-2017]